MQSTDIDNYVDEVESKLLEETDYNLERESGQRIHDMMGHHEGINLPEYHDDRSSERILTMTWMEGMHLDKFLTLNPSQAIRNLVGQRLWDFYMELIHTHKFIHADPHPGNFLFHENGELSVLDFGCMKSIPQDFYEQYFQILGMETNLSQAEKERVYTEMELIYDNDPEEERKFYIETFDEMVDLLCRPFRTKQFDFGDEEFFQAIFEMGEEASKSALIRNSKRARGNRHALYINRTFFGLYQILHSIGAVIDGTAKMKESAAEVS